MGIRDRIVLLGVLMLGGWGMVWAAPPLTLQEALAHADEPTPELARSRARLEQARAREASTRSETGWRMEGRMQARWSPPPAVFDYLGGDDHGIELRLARRLWDFGQTRAGRDQARQETEASRWLWMGARQARRYQILERFFAVVLADLEYAYRNEAMSIAYVRFDRIRERARRGQRSELEVLEAEAVFQESRRAVYRAQAEQRASRARLALALNRPGELPGDVAIPEPGDFMAWQAGEWETWREAVNRGSLRLAEARARVEAARARLVRAQGARRPVVSLEARSGLYSRQSPGNGPWSAGIGVSWPIYSGGAVTAAQAEARAHLGEAETALEGLRREELQAALEDWLTLGTLRVDWEAVRKDLEYRELRLDQARLRYEQEVESDLGDALVELSRAQLEVHRVAYAYALAHARLLARAGRLLEAHWP